MPEMSQFIPEGYELASDQYFKTVGMLMLFMDQYCKKCFKSECDVREKVESSIGNRGGYWNSSYLLSIIDKSKNERVICKEYEEKTIKSKA